MTSSSRYQSRWVVMIVFMIAHGVTDGFLWVIPPLLPALRDQFHLSYTEMGSLYSLFRFSGDILQAPVAYLVHIAPISLIMTGGLLWTSVGMFLASLASGYGMLAWSFTVSGIGRATYHPLAATLLSRAFGREALGRAIALHMTGSSVGQFIAPFLVGIFLTYYGWRSPIMIWSGLGILAGLILYFFLRKQKENLGHRGKGLSLPFFSRPIGIYLLAVSVWAIAQHALMTFLPSSWWTTEGLARRRLQPFMGSCLFRPLSVDPSWGLSWIGWEGASPSSSEGSSSLACPSSAWPPSSFLSSCTSALCSWGSSAPAIRVCLIHS